MDHLLFFWTPPFFETNLKCRSIAVIIRTNFAYQILYFYRNDENTQCKLLSRLERMSVFKNLVERDSVQYFDFFILMHIWFSRGKIKLHLVCELQHNNNKKTKRSKSRIEFCNCFTTFINVIFHHWSQWLIEWFFYIERQEKLTAR